MNPILEYSLTFTDPNLECAITRGLMCLTKSREFRGIDFHRADIPWMRNLILEDLNIKGIDERNWQPKDYKQMKTLALLEYKWMNTVYDKKVVFYLDN